MSDSDRKKVTLPVLYEKMAQGTPLTMVTCYDYPMAYLVEQAGIDIVLVGDSLGMTILGYDSTLPVTMDDMVRHAQAVRRGTPNAWLVGDMPYMSYQPSDEAAVRNAGRFMAEAACDAIKLEGGREVLERIQAITRAGIPVMGHLGLTPQSIHQFGGFKVQAKDEAAARKLLEDALALEEAGAFAVVLEGIPQQLARLVTERLGIPTIGIGAGPDCDGQVLVTHDLLGIFDRFVPKFVKQYAKMYELMLESLSRYVQEVENGTFPGPEHCFNIEPEVLESLYRGEQLGRERSGDHQ